MPSKTAKLAKLDFKEKLIQSGKGGGQEALLKRLKTLHLKLKELEQDGTDLKSLNAVHKQLIDRIILHHKDRGVKAYAACCLADLLRLYAPDAPYTGDELRDIFQFFVVQITQNLKYQPGTRPLAPSKKNNDASSQPSQAARINEIPYYNEYSYLLDNLASIKSVILICELPSADDLITTYFDSFADIVRPDMKKLMVRNMASILADLLNEADTVPTGVMDCIFGQFENYGTTPERPSFQLIADVCNRAALKLQRPTFAHFSEIQLSHGRDPSPSDLKILTSSHQLLLTIFRHAPNLLLNTIPLLEENLQAAEEVPLRELSTRTLGTMLGERPMIGNASVDMARAFPSAWRQWLGRRVDKALSVRLAWVEAAATILVNRPEHREVIEGYLVDRIQDADERVRAAVCKIIGSLDYGTALNHISQPLLRAVGGRMSDKKSAVRAEAIDALAKLWHNAFTEIGDNSEEAIEQFGWIPQEMLLTLFRRDVTPELRGQITVAFKTKILPLPTKPDDEQAWVDKFLQVTSQLNDNALRALDRLTGFVGYSRGHSPWRAFVDACEDNNGGISDKEQGELAKQRMHYVFNAIAAMLFGDQDKARKDMETFAAANEPRMYRNFRAIVDPQSDLRTIVKARQELLRRIQQAHSGIYDTFTTIIEAAGWNLINHSSIGGFIKRLAKPEGSNGNGNAARVAEVAARYLSLIAKECAPMYKSHVDQLVMAMNDKKNDTLVEVALQALAALCKLDKDAGPKDKKVVERAAKLALTGTPRQAKFASRFIANCNDPEAATELVTRLWEDLRDGDDEHILPLLRSAAELAISAPVAFETKTTEIIGFVMNEVMLRKSPSEEVEDDRWVEEDKLDNLDRAKLEGMRVITHRSLGWARDEHALELVDPTFRLLTTIIKNLGQVSDMTAEGPQARLHMRLRATLCLIKLANVRLFDRHMTKFFPDIAFMLQDENFTVRNRLLKKLAEVLPTQRRLPRWNILPVLVAQDPEAENVVIAKSLILANIRTCMSLGSKEDRIERIEMPLARLLHLLAHHPDLDWSSATEVKDLTRFIELFVEMVANPDNASLLFTIANKLKTVRDAAEDLDQAQIQRILDSSTSRVKPAAVKDEDGDEPMSEAGDSDSILTSPTLNLYKLAELAQIIIKARAHHHGWNITTSSVAVKLPRDIFHNLPDPATARQIASQTYLPPAIEEWAQGLGRKPVATRPERRKRERVARSPKPRKQRRSTRRAARDSDSETDSDEDSDSDDEGTGDEEEGDEGEDGENAVMGRGGRRSAKVRATRKVQKRKRRERKRERSERSASAKSEDSRARSARSASEASELSALSS